MKRVIKLFLLIVCVLVSIRATCGKTKPAIKDPVQAMKFKDYVYYHNVSITFDGRHYFTVNGGNDSWCMINEYTVNGEHVRTYDVELDARAILYNKKNGKLYVKIYGKDLYKIDLKNESAEIVHQEIFKDDNSSPAISSDGKYLYELLMDGRVRVLDLKTGKKVKGFSLEHTYDDHGYVTSIAVSDYYLFAWAGEDALYVYDLDGEYLAEVDLPRSGYGFSLSYCKGLLWIAKDADGSSDGATGHWYGYRL